ncbi:MAG: bifunctional UDP-N-acetylglucosamine pyrophosphorylase / Glucosamine-1-phosphate N-acetyltransferase [Desulfobacteraceae bacterium Eth-SRB1]|nr:MAG: bifunctional UDP-N-acetylglucosamine pyrophosphorylase / Glucosamine-1-phosphate N-acetyltransferase [Desulfobacteraceae bacterium Eth-SRB1]
MQNTENRVAVIILAAGMGTRMKSSKPKVLHEILGKPMVMYVVKTANKVAGSNVILVVGNQAEKVREVLSENYELIFALQEKQLGTGHAVLCALPYVPEYIEQVVILCGDVPLLSSSTVLRLLDDHIRKKRDVTLLAVEVDNPEGYGRVLFDKNMDVFEIVEEADASEEQKKIKIINTGIYCVKKKFLIDSLHKIKSNNAQCEYYLTDIIKIGYLGKKVVGVMVGTDCEEVIGVNNDEELIAAENIMRKIS